MSFFLEWPPLCLSGGYDGLNILNSVEKYDPHTGHWTNVTPMATKRSGKTSDLREGTVPLSRLLAWWRHSHGTASQPGLFPPHFYRSDTRSDSFLLLPLFLSCCETAFQRAFTSTGRSLPVLFTSPSLSPPCIVTSGSLVLSTHYGDECRQNLT